jgi:Replication-relaxation
MAKLELREFSRRDGAILADLGRVRLLSGRQLERLHFQTITTPNARGSARRRSLSRLVDTGLVVTLLRRVGGERAGSAGLVYTLDARGHRLLDGHADPANRRIRRPWSIGWPFVQHSLDVAELYVRLREREAAGQLRLLQFATEPACWYGTAHGTLKPDAWAVYETSEWEEHWWLEVDRGTESLPTLTRKLRQYIDFAASGEPGPLGVIPRVLLLVTSAARRAAAERLIDTLPPPAPELIEIAEFPDVFQGSGRPPPS